MARKRDSERCTYEALCACNSKKEIENTETQTFLTFVSHWKHNLSILDTLAGLSKHDAPTPERVVAAHDPTLPTKRSHETLENRSMRCPV